MLEAVGKYVINYSCMFSIEQTEHIKAPREVVWDVITRTEEYPVWNKFIIECRSTFAVGSPIAMRVRVLPRRPMRQTEKILSCNPGEYLDYGMKIPLGILSSSRRHILTRIDADNTKYESMFRLKGLLAPVVRFLLGRQLRRGFTDMTEGIAARAEELRGEGR